MIFFLRLRIKKRKVIFVSSSDWKFDLMNQLNFMRVFTSDQVSRNGVASMNSHKRIERVFMKKIPN